MNKLELLEMLHDIPEDYEILISCDEEFNVLFGRGEVAIITDRKKTAVIYGLSGSEVE